MRHFPETPVLAAAAGVLLLFAATPATAAGDDPAPASDAASIEEIEAGLENADEARLPVLLDEAAAVDLARALELAAQHEAGHGIIAGRWRPGDAGIGDAFATALNAPPSQYRDHLVLGLIHQWVRADPAAAEKAIRSLPEGSRRSDLVEQFHLALLRFRPEVALAAAIAKEGAPDAIDLRDAALALAKSDLGAARDALAGIPEDRPATREVVAGAIARIWAAADPGACAKWAATLPLESERAPALEEAVFAWSESRPVEAGEWVSTLEAGSARDAALQALVFQAAPGHPALAFDWARLVSDAELRETCLGTALFTWSESDEAAALAAVAASDLGEEEKAALRALLETPGS